MILEQINTKSRSTLLRCELRGTFLANEFPEGCPWRSEYPGDVVRALERKSFIPGYGGQVSERERADSEHLLAVADCCRACLGRYAGHLTIALLRRRAGFDV